MRETLRMMSLSQFSYAISYIIFQGIFQVIGSTIMAGFLIYNESVWGPVDTLSRSLQFWCCSLLFCCGQIPYAMAISSFFKDPKVANTIGGLLIILPIAFSFSLPQSTMALNMSCTCCFGYQSSQHAAFWSRYLVV